MKRWIRATLVIGLALGSWQVSADARFLDLEKQEQVPGNPAPAHGANSIPPPTPPGVSHNTEVAPKRISLRFENLSLVNVLKSIHQETGVSFSINPEMETDPFSAAIQADNWETAIKELLKDFSRVEIWTGRLETSRVWVMSGQDGNSEDFQRNTDIRLSRQVPVLEKMPQPAQKKRNVRAAPAPGNQSSGAN